MIPTVILQVTWSSETLRSCSTSTFGKETFSPDMEAKSLLLSFPNTDAALARRIMDRIRGACANREMYENAGEVTVSIGITASNGDRKFSEMIDEADKALYRAKENGRNRVECYSFL